MFTLIQNGEIYTPDPLGRTSLLIASPRIARVGPVDPRGLDALGVEHEVVDAAGCVVVPGLIDPHVHLLGGSGEEGFSTQTPEFFLEEIVRYGTTTVVGVLGVDTTMKTMPGLLARAKALKEDGLNAFIWTGGYNVPPTSIMETVRDDIMFIEEVIGAGEIAISDRRGMDPRPHELARLATDCYVGGMLARKAGVMHLHVGSGDARLAPLREMLDRYDVKPEWLYPTHVERSEALMREAVELSRRGVTVDVDTVAEDLLRWFRFYLENDGDPGRFTASSDAGRNSPRTLYEQVRGCVLEGGYPLERVLPIVTRNTARVLRLGLKGVLEVGRDADVLVLERGSLEVVHVLSRGRWLVRDGSPVARDRFLKDSDREIHLVGEKR